VTACVDFLEKVYGLNLTIGQRAFVRVAIDRVPPTAIEDEAERTAAEEIFGSWSEAPEAAWRTVNAACGRDSGKTELGAGIALFKMLSVDVSKCGPGDVPRAFIVAPDVDTAKLTLERAVARVEASDDLRPLLVGAPTADGFLMRRPDGRPVRFEVRAAARGGRTIRGRSIVCLILDEAALFFGDGYAVNDREIVKAATPRMLPGALVLLLSTPWAAEGLFYENHEKNHGQPVTAIAAHASTLVMRDNDPELVQRVALEEAEDPDNAAREYRAEFLPTGASVFFDDARVTAAQEHTWIVELATAAKAAGADIGLVQDSSALAVVARDGDRYELVESAEMRPEKGKPLKLSQVIATFAATLKRHALSTLSADGHVREPAREHAAEHKIKIAPAPEGNAAKFDSYVHARKLLADGKLKLPRSPRLVAQLRAVRSVPLPGGAWRISTPRSKALGHCDLLSALIVALWAAKSATPPLDFWQQRERRRNANQLARIFGGGLMGFGADDDLI
jgi:hypothetical protein